MTPEDKLVLNECMNCLSDDEVMAKVNHAFFMVPLSINELNLIRTTHKTSLDNIEAEGTASDKAYIGVDKAKEVAFKHASIAAAYFQKSTLFRAGTKASPYNIRCIASINKIILVTSFKHKDSTFSLHPSLFSLNSKRHSALNRMPFV